MSFVMLVVLYTFPTNITLTNDYPDEISCLKDMKMVKQELEGKVEVRCLPLLNAIVVDGEV